MSFDACFSNLARIISSIYEDSLVKIINFLLLLFSFIYSLLLEQTPIFWINSIKYLPKQVIQILLAKNTDTLEFEAKLYSLLINFETEKKN